MPTLERKKNTNRLFVATYIIILVIGLCLIITSIAVGHNIDNDQFMSSLLINSGTGLIVTSVVSFLLYMLLGKQGSVMDKMDKHEINDHLKFFSKELVDSIGAIRYKKKVEHFFLTERVYGGYYREKDVSEMLIRKYTVKKKVRVGPIDGGVVINYFVDFMDAVMSDKKVVDHLVNEFVYLIEKTCTEFEKNGDSIGYSTIAAHKMGNPLLALLLSQKLERKCVLYNELDKSTDFNTIYSPLEGDVENGERVIIIHDVLATANRIKPMVDFLKDKGAIVEHVFVLIKRNDRAIIRCKPEKYFYENGVKLHWLFTYNDRQLEQLKN